MTSKIAIDKMERTFNEIETPNLNVDDHKNWYFCSVCYVNPNATTTDKLRWYRFVVFAKDKVKADSLAHRKACLKKHHYEDIKEINLYKANYIKEARELIKNNQYCY